ncbi:MAG: hypothetical protein M3198_08860 [Actinomycetota bacterium]|nr:hypothetical protein [Actinomycetota bacterium]
MEIPANWILDRSIPNLLAVASDPAGDARLIVASGTSSEPEVEADKFEVSEGYGLPFFIRDSSVSKDGDWMVDYRFVSERPGGPTVMAGRALFVKTSRALLSLTLEAPVEQFEPRLPVLDEARRSLR